jgi:hypothetical protein
VVFHSALPGSWNWLSSRPLALAWRRDEQSAAARRCLDYLRSYRDRHAWISDPDVAPLTSAAGEMPGEVAAAYR